jgi:hypothetical protein
MQNKRDHIREYQGFNIYIDPLTKKYYADTSAVEGLHNTVIEVMQEIRQINSLTL